VQHRNKEHILGEYLVLKAQSGDTLALAQLVEIWSDRLNRRAVHLLGDHDAAGDAMQESWIGIARSIRSLRDPSLFGPWAMRIVHHKCADSIRAKVRERKLKRSYARQDHSKPEPVDPAPVRTAICLLSRKYRDVLILYYMDEYPVDLISIILGIPVGTVKTRLRRARAQLKPMLEKAI
jgi:RNA polymerase sigma-70 factor (ECF subfamily)